MSNYKRHLRIRSLVIPAGTAHCWLPPPLTRTAADGRIRFLSERVVCRTHPAMFRMGKMIGRSRFLSRQPQRRACEVCFGFQANLKRELVEKCLTKLFGHLISTVKNFSEGSFAAVSPLTIQHKLHGRRLVVRTDDCVLCAEFLVAGFDVDVGANHIVGLDHTFESECAIRFRMADGCINNDVGVTRCFCEPDVRVLNWTTVWPLDDNWN